MRRISLIARNVLILALLIPLPLAADEELSPLITDRPDYTESAETVPRGGIQLEFGYTYGEDDDVKSHALGELLVRAALGDWAELRVGLNSYAFKDGPFCDCDGLENSYLGAKFVLAEAPEDPGSARPGVAVLVGTTLPTGDEAFGEDEYQPEVTLALAWDLTGRLALGSNLGYAHASDDGERIDEFAGSLSLGLGATDTLGFYLE